MIRILHISTIFFLLSTLSSDSFEGLTLITSIGGGTDELKYSHLIDNDQNIINSWTHDTPVSSTAYLMPDSILYVPCKINQGGPQTPAGRFKKVDWDGNIIWDYTLPQDICVPHHDIAVLPNGNILSICSETKTQQEAEAFGILNINGSMTLDMIVEIRPEDNNQASIVWEWHFWDHLIQDINPSLDNYGSLSDNPQLLDINCPGSLNGGNQGISDWNHCNSVSYNSILDQIVISSRHMDEFFVIDHSTTSIEAAGHSGGDSGKGGDFLYRWGNPQNYNRGNNSDKILDAQHGVNWIPAGYPGEGNLILFNNGHSSNPSASAGLEFIPPLNEDGSYELNANLAYGPEEEAWLYWPGGGFYTGVQGGTFRLPNGNTLLTDADDTKIREVTNDGIIVWEYNYPGNNNALIARANKYAIDYFDQQNIAGDLNYDEILNVLDVIILVNMAINEIEDDLNGDMNEDEIINILDIVILAGIILG